MQLYPCQPLERIKARSCFHPSIVSCTKGAVLGRVAWIPLNVVQLRLCLYEVTWGEDSTTRYIRRNDQIIGESKPLPNLVTVLREDRPFLQLWLDAGMVSWIRPGLGGWSVGRDGIVALLVFLPKDMLVLRFLCAWYRHLMDSETHVVQERVFNSCATAVLMYVHSAEIERGPPNRNNCDSRAITTIPGSCSFPRQPRWTSR